MAAARAKQAAAARDPMRAYSRFLRSRSARRYPRYYLQGQNYLHLGWHWHLPGLKQHFPAWAVRGSLLPSGDMPLTTLM